MVPYLTVKCYYQLLFILNTLFHAGLIKVPNHYILVYLVIKAVHFLNDVFNDVELTQNNTYTIIANLKSESAYKLINRKVGSVCFVCLFVLLLNVPSQQLGSWRDGQFT